MLSFTHDTRTAGSRGILCGYLECVVTCISPKYAYTQLHAKGYGYTCSIWKCKGYLLNGVKLRKGQKGRRYLPTTCGLREDAVTKMVGKMAAPFWQEGWRGKGTSCMVRGQRGGGYMVLHKANTDPQNHGIS